MPLSAATLSRTFTHWVARLQLMFGQSHSAEATLSQLLARCPGDAHALASRAHLRAQAGRWAEAITDAQALLAARPQRRAADAFNLAYMLERADRLAEAEQAFRQALAIDERLDRAWYGLGLTLIRLQRLDEAVAALRRNTELQPMSPYGWYQLARVHADRQQPEETLRIIRHLKGFEPKVAAQLQRETGLAA